MNVFQKTLLGNALDEGALPTFPNPQISLLGQWKGARRTMCITDQMLGCHMLLVGSSGCGKTNCITEVLKQLKSKMTDRDSMIVFDPKGDFLGLSDGGDYILSSSGSTACWNIFGEVTADGWDESSIRENAREICQTVFAEAIDHSSNPFFPKAARDLMADIISAMGLIGADDRDFRNEYLNNAILSDYLREADVKRITDFLSKVPSCSGSLKYLGDGSSEQSLGVLAELQEATEGLFMGDFGREGALSARRLQRAGGSTLFVEYDIGKAASPAYQVIVDTYLKEALSRNHDPRSRVYVVVDELRRLPHLQFLEGALSFGRSRGLRVIAALQSIEQLYEVYGEVGGRVLASGFQTLVSFSSNNAATREYVQGVSGARLAEITWSSSDGRSKSEMHKGSTVEEWDLVSLSVGQAVVIQRDAVPFRFTFERYA